MSNAFIGLTKDAQKKKLKDLFYNNASYFGRFACIGLSYHEFNQIKPSKINSLMQSVHLESIDKADLQNCLDFIEEHRDSTEAFVVNFFAEGECSYTDLVYFVSKKAVELDIPSTELLQKAISPYVVQHQKVLANTREFNKLQREGAWVQLLMDGLTKELKRELKSGVPITVFKAVEIQDDVGKPDRTLIINLGDLHIGALVKNSYTGGYNYAILQERLKTYLQHIHNMVKLWNPNEIVINGLGDYIEHINMRNVNQAFEAEFPATEQVAKATKTLLSFLESIQTMTTAPIRFYMIAGNHDRFSGNKADAIYNDSVAYIILDTLLLLKNHSNLLHNITIYDNREDVNNVSYTVQGLIIMLDHGTNLKGFGSNINKFIKDKSIDLLITGHIHHVVQMQEDFTRMHIVNSSPMGSNNYAKQLKLPETAPSQTLLIVGSDISGVITYPIML